MTDTQTLEARDAVDPETGDVETPDTETPDVSESVETAPQPAPLFVDEYADPGRYDYEYGTDGADLPFYLELAAASGPESTARVLDVATGTGRVALALAAAGHEVTAVDINTGMLAVGAGKDVADTVTWVEQDARELKVRGKFDVAVLGGNALQQFISNADRAALLKGIYRHLHAGGTLALAVRFPHAGELARRVEAPEIWHSYTDAAGSQVVVSGTQRYDAATQVMVHETYRQYAVDGTAAATPTTTAVRYSFPQELQAALEAARFEVEGVYVDFAGTPLTAQSAPTASALVFVARKPQKVAKDV